MEESLSTEGGAPNQKLLDVTVEIARGEVGFIIQLISKTVQLTYYAFLGVEFDQQIH